MPDQRLDTLESTVVKLSDAVDTLVSEFLRPLTKQVVENREAITQLTESNQRYADWLDEDRRDINAARAEYQQSIQLLIDEAKADRKRADERFAKFEERFTKADERFAKFDERFAKADERFAKFEERFTKADERFAKFDERFAKFDERFEKFDERFAKADERFAKADERFEAVQAEIRQSRKLLMSNQERLDRNQQRIDTMLTELLSLSRRVDAVEDAA